MKERFIKSRERVRKYGEVYTPDWLVKDMCDMLSEEGGAWSRLDETFLEPACGTGNFLVEILERKFRLCKDYKDGLKALSTIWGIDILPDNVQESRTRMLNMYKERYPDGINEAARILEENIICGDSLKIMKQWADEEKENECGKTERTY